MAQKKVWQSLTPLEAARFVGVTSSLSPSAVSNPLCGKAGFHKALAAAGILIALTRFE